jgi:lipid-A-disaccharide synthase-like uncharacterized protein
MRHMDWLASGGKFLGIEWNVWKAVGWAGNIAFFSRFFVQWYASEKQRRVVVPVAFWWLSLVGSLLLLLYALFYRRDSVFIFAYAFTWIPYIRNLVIHSRSNDSKRCGACGESVPAHARFCLECGASLAARTKE